MPTLAAVLMIVRDSAPDFVGFAVGEHEDRQALERLFRRDASTLTVQ